ncbi:MAG: UDP-2,3-diacylglucosamine diphosphatase LpxI [Alphaproteobacteria bacterium]|nr:UDP-2,3-diacylglucosamine diphosphatase LpxI [Alphaproteobacteria bacterium]
MTAGALGIIAGGGDLPIAVAEAAAAAGRAVFILALKGSADEGVARFAHEWNTLGEVGRAMKLLRAHGVNEVLLAGKVARPRFSEVKLDAKGLMVLPRVVAAARKGDDALLRYMVSLFEDEGFKAIGVAEAAPALLAREGVFGHVKPGEDDLADIAVAVKVVRAMGALDIGQAAAVCAGLVLAVEAAEGTDRMIARVADLPEAIRGVPGKPKGVLVKAPKPLQDGKTDLPVIGTDTVKNVAAAGLAGIAVEAGAALIMNRAGVIAAADEAGIFVMGFARTAYPG